MTTETKPLDIPSVGEQVRLNNGFSLKMREMGMTQKPVTIITHESAFEALCSERGAEAFDYLCDLWLRPYNATQRHDRIGLDYHLGVWFIHARAWPELDPREAVKQLELL